MLQRCRCCTHSITPILRILLTVLILRLWVAHRRQHCSYVAQKAGQVRLPGAWGQLAAQILWQLQVLQCCQVRQQLLQAMCTTWSSGSGSMWRRVSCFHALSGAIACAASSHPASRSTKLRRLLSVLQLIGKRVNLVSFSSCDVSCEHSDGLTERCQQPRWQHGHKHTRSTRTDRT